MDPVSIVIGVAVGGGVGAAIAATMGKGKVQELERKLDKLEEESGKAQKLLKEGQQGLDKAREEAKELKDRLEKSKKSLKDAESAKKKHQEVAKKLEQQAKDVESKAKAAESHAKEAETKAKELEKQAKEVESKAEQLAREAAEKAKQVDKLKEDLKRAGNGQNAATYEAVKGDLDGILKVLCEHEKQEAAVIADTNGIVVAAFGDAKVKDGMAAAANRITKIGDQLKGMVDFAQVSTFRISDAGNKVIAGRTFDVAGEMLALATVGEQMPSDASLDGAMNNLSAALGA